MDYLGTPGNDTISGTTSNDVMHGLAGDDSLDGGASFDTIYGEEGNDTLIGGTGNDTLYGGSGVDHIDGGDGFDQAVLDLSDEVAGVSYDAEAAFTSMGTTLSDGTTVRNIESINLKTGAGADTFSAAAGVRRFIWWDGGAGVDTLNFDLSTETSGSRFSLYTDTTIRLDGPLVVAFITNVEKFHFVGGSYGDYLNGLAGDDSLDGGGGDDNLSGGGGDDLLTGGAGNDKITGGACNDTLSGDDGDDNLSGGSGVDLIDGGSGYDWSTLDLRGESAAVAYDVAAAASAGVIVLANGTTVRSVEGVNLATGRGNDTLRFNLDPRGYSSWHAGESTDLLILDFGGQISGIRTYLYAGGFLDVYGSGAAGSYNVAAYEIERVAFTGGSGNDILNGLAGDDVLKGRAGDDWLIGNGGNDAIDGGTGDDHIEAGLGITAINGGAGIDRLSLNLSSATADIVYDPVTAATVGGLVLADGTMVRNVEYLDQLWTGSGKDSLTIKAGSGDIYWASGAGDDILTVTAPKGTVTWHADDGSDRLVLDLSTDEGGVTSTVSSNGAKYEVVNATGDFVLDAFFIEAVTLTGGLNDDRLIGLVGDDILLGGYGHDSLTGRAGNDWLDGGFGVDAMVGGAGNDTYVIDNVNDSVAELVNQGADTVYTSVSYAMGTAEIETVYLTGSDDINVTAGAGVTSVVGNAGNNRIDGGAGGDTLAGGGGDDTYWVDDAFDRVIEVAGEGWDTVYSSVGFTIGNSYIEAVVLTGSASVDLIGNSLDNQLTGNAGNNLIYGGLGADTMAGGAGNDSYSVENLGDRVIEGAGGGVDSVVSTVSFGLGANVENLTLAGNNAIDGSGNELANVITGNNAANVLAGGGGGDRLIGRGGDDIYWHTDGDVIVERAGEGNDTVYSGSLLYRMAANLENLYLVGGRTGVGNELDNVMVGDGGHNFLDGGAGNDTLTGGGDIDVFIFVPGSGVDVITDLHTVSDWTGLMDRINVNAYSHGTAWGGGITVSQSGVDTVIDFGGGNKVTVLNADAVGVAHLIVW
ncbi:MAG: hypothetical protein JF615_02435 [Asticcacaulis sp.]|nr:hypothetical protein [Asticcacaulis sp.]